MVRVTYSLAKTAAYGLARSIISLIRMDVNRLFHLELFHHDPVSCLPPVSDVPASTFPSTHDASHNSMAFGGSCASCMAPSCHGGSCMDHVNREPSSKPPHPSPEENVNLVFTASFVSGLPGGFRLTGCFARGGANVASGAVRTAPSFDAPRRFVRSGASRASLTSCCSSHAAWRRTCATRGTCTAVRQVPPLDRYPFSKGILDWRNPKSFLFERETDPSDPRSRHERTADADGADARSCARAWRWSSEEAKRRCLEDTRTPRCTCQRVQVERRRGRGNGGQQQQTWRQILACCRRCWHRSTMDGMDVDGFCSSHRSQCTTCSSSRCGMRNLGSACRSKEAPSRTGTVEHDADGAQACEKTPGGRRGCQGSPRSRAGCCQNRGDSCSCTG